MHAPILSLSKIKWTYVPRSVDLTDETISNSSQNTSSKIKKRTRVFAQIAETPFDPSIVGSRESRRQTNPSYFEPNQRDFEEEDDNGKKTTKKSIPGKIKDKIQPESDSKKRKSEREEQP